MNVPGSIRIALADDQIMVREGLKSILAGIEDIEVVAEAGTGEELLGLLDDTEIDLILSDIRMPALDGIAMTRRLRASGSAVPVLLLTTFDDEDLLPQAAEAGAQGFLLKDVDPADLEDAIRALMAGRSLLQPVTTGQIRRRFGYHDERPPEESFSSREIEILRLLAGGYSNREIAETIHLAEGTVKNYVSEILAKLGTRDRTRAVLKAITLHII